MNKPVNRYKPSGGKNKALVRFLCVFIIFLVTYIFYDRTDPDTEQAADGAKKVLAEHITKEAELSASVKKLNNSVHILEKRLKESHDEVDKEMKISKELMEKMEDSKNTDKANGTDESKKEIEKLNESVDLYTQQLDRLKGEIQKKAKIDAEKKFGPGPHKVKFELDFNPEEIPEGTATSFTIEMAPLDLMPYTVNQFLSQVSLGLLNGCSFHRNAGHVVQGGPVSNHLNPGTNPNKGFKDAGLESVIFQEYSADFPHKKYTLGYAGRPGGPDFYVSTVDNTRNHGPGGQDSYAIKSEADPCFAKVVEGFEAVDRMHKLSVKPGGYKRLVHYVAIKSAEIIASEEN